MTLSQRCGASFVPFLSRLVLALVFTTYGYHLCFQDVPYTEKDAQKLRALGFDIGPAVVSASTPEINRASFSQDPDKADEAESSQDPDEGTEETDAEGDDEPSDDTEGDDEPSDDAVGDGHVGLALYVIALDIDRNNWSSPSWLPRVGAIAAGATQLVGGVLLFFGLFSRLWALGLVISMGCAFYLTSWDLVWPLRWAIVDPSDPSGTGQFYQVSAQLALLMLSLGIVFTGPGALSLDRFLFRSSADKEDVAE